MNLVFAGFLYILAGQAAQVPRYATAVLVTRDTKLAQGFDRLKTRDEVGRFFLGHQELDRIVTKDGYVLLIDKRLVKTKTGWAVERVEQLIQSRGLPCALKLADLSPDDREACLTLLRSAPMNAGRYLSNPDTKLVFTASFRATLRKGDQALTSIGDIGTGQVNTKDVLTGELSENHPRTPSRSNLAEIEDDWTSVQYFFQNMSGRITRAKLALAVSKRLEEMIAEDEQRRRNQELDFFRTATGLKNWNGQSELDAESLSPAMQASLKQGFNVRSLAGYRVTDCRPSITAWIVHMEDGYPAWSGFGLGTIRG